jgi:hypothetical protein
MKGYAHKLLAYKKEVTPFQSFLFFVILVCDVMGWSSCVFWMLISLSEWHIMVTFMYCSQNNLL